MFLPTFVFVMTIARSDSQTGSSRGRLAFRKSAKATRIVLKPSVRQKMMQTKKTLIMRMKTMQSLASL